MEKSIIEALAEALHRTLMDTGKFVTGYPFATARTGARPTFNVWWAGFRESGPESRASKQPTITTFTYILEVRENLTPDAEGCQRRLMQLVQACREAILAENRLGPTKGVLRSRIVSAVHEPDVNDDQPMLVAQLTVEIDYAGAWVAPES